MSMRVKKTKLKVTSEKLSQIAIALLAGIHTPGLSSIEALILRSTIPITIDETEEITALGQRGIWANRKEALNWKGEIPLSDYTINDDKNPELITKKLVNQLEYIQELAVRYLRPPTPPAPGDIIITQEANTLAPPAPPLVIRQQPNRPCTPEPLVIRELPPKQPVSIGRKVITISGKSIPPPPRKVVIERLAPLPAKPQAVVVERWLPYNQMKRKVIFKGAPPDPVIIKPRNVIVQWSPPEVIVKKEIKYLGVLRANPADYVQRYGSSLKYSNELPQFILDIKPPEGIILAADYVQKESTHDLVGEIEALNLIDVDTLEKEGLGQYKSLLKNRSPQTKSHAKESTNKSPTHSDHMPLIEKIFHQIDLDGNGNLSAEEARQILMKIKPRLNKNYTDEDLKKFFKSLDKNNTGIVRIQEFRQEFRKLL